MFEVGQVVEISPSANAWLAGDRSGIISKVGRKWIHVQCGYSGRTRKMPPSLLTLAAWQPTPPDDALRNIEGELLPLYNDDPALYNNAFIK
jgi:hypothetical protein